MILQLFRVEIHELTKKDEIVDRNGVKIMGDSNILE